jgi:hypothetical protein
MTDCLEGLAGRSLDGERVEEDTHVDARELMTRLCSLIDAREWDALPALLHDEFVCHYVHTGEMFDRNSWVRLNAEYPGFDHLVLADLVSSDTRAVGRCHVTAYVDGRLAHFEVATFVTVRDALISEIVEVWTDVTQTPPAGARPS